MQTGICNMPLLPLRSEPSERAEMISQVLFGELFEVLSENDSWSQIRNLSDNYTGWCTKKMLQILPSSVFETLKNTKPTFTHALLSASFKQGEERPALFLPAGSRLYFLDQDTSCFSVFMTKIFGAGEPEKEYWSIKSDAFFSGKIETPEILDTAMLFVNAPYLWGGKSILGIDCSGLVQVVFSMYGQFLPRNAKDQALLGKIVPFLSEAKSGDLAFFSNAKGMIVHVGILADNSHILHASGSVHIDRIDSHGIFSEALGGYTHALCSIKRISSSLND